MFVTQIKKLVMFLLPILKLVLADVVIDVANKATREDRRRPTRYGYSRYERPRSRRLYGDIRPTLEDNPYPPGSTNRSRHDQGLPPLKADWETLVDKGYHDVLMVAFDIAGPNMALVQEWLMLHLPNPTADEEADVNLDSWWIADDTAGNADYDSAVFVTKGNQKAARELLREHGLVN